MCPSRSTVGWTGWTRRARFGLPCLALLGGGCLAPPAGEEGSLEDFARLVAEAGARPVHGTVEEGRTGEMEDAPLPAPEEAEELAEELDEYDEPEEYEQDPYLVFGERIIVHPPSESGDTFITKPYSLPPGRPDKVVTMLGALDPFSHRQRAQAGPDGSIPPLDPEILEYEILDGLDDEIFTNFESFEASPQAPTQIPVSDVLVVTATPRLLWRFEEFLDLFAGGGVPQIELEAKVIEIVETDTEDYGGNATFTFGETNFIREFGVNLPNFSSASEAILSLGAIQDATVFEGLLEVVKSWQNVNVESRPRTVVRTGGVARMETITRIPVLEIKTLSSDGSAFTTNTTYKDVGITLWISPRLVGSRTLALDIRVESSQRAGAQAIISTSGSGGASLEIPTIASRTARTVVHLKPGETLLIGGLTQEREQEIVSAVPILGELPLIGFFFRSTFTAVETQTVLFSISPRIIQKSDLQPD